MSASIPPQPLRAAIDPGGCIGCAKCLPACPVDAILGARQQLHQVLTAVCTGCGLCLPPCPTNCIELTPAALDFEWPTRTGGDRLAAIQFLDRQAAQEARRSAARVQRLAVPALADEAAEYVSPPADPEALRQALDDALARVGRRGLGTTGRQPGQDA